MWTEDHRDLNFTDFKEKVIVLRNSQINNQEIITQVEKKINYLKTLEQLNR